MSIASEITVRPPRIVWVDAAKGVAIVLVVFGHVLGGALARGWLAPDPWRNLYEFIYLIHMPVFFMVSGLLLAEGARIKPMDTIVSRIGSIAWPYFFWDVVLRYSLLPFAGRFMGVPPEHIGLLDWLRRAVSGELSWFFWTLFMVQMIFIVLAPISVFVLLAISLVLAVLCDYAKLGSLQYIIAFIPFLLLGASVQPFMQRLCLRGGALPAVGALFLLAIIFYAVNQGWTAMQSVKMVCSIAGIFSTIVLVQYLPQFLERGLLSKLGAASLAIYVLHPYFQGATRALLTAYGNATVSSQIVLQTFVAVAGPFVAWVIAERAGAGWLFRLDLRRRTQMG